MFYSAARANLGINTAIRRLGSDQNLEASTKRRFEIDQLILDLGSKLAPGELSVLKRFALKDSNCNVVKLKNGNEVAVTDLRNLMLRLELMSVVSRENFQALARFARYPTVQLSDWHKINSEVYGIGVVKESVAFRPMVALSLFSFAPSSNKLFSSVQFNFRTSPDERSVIVAVTSFVGKSYQLVSPKLFA